MKLAHGGYNDFIDFEEAMKAGINPHGAGHAGHGAPHGDAPKAADSHAKADAKDEDPIRRILKHQEEEARKEQEKPKMAQTGDGAQVVFDPAETGHPKTPAADEPASPTAAAEDLPSSSPAAEDTAADEETRGHVADEL